MMPMRTTFCRSRVRLLPLVAILAVAASLEPLTPLSKAMAIDIRALAKGGASVLDEAAHSSLDKKLKHFKDGVEHGIEGSDFWDDHKDELKEQLQLLTPGAEGSSPAGAAGYVVDTGNLKSLVHGIDINSPVTRTGPCEVGARAVSCSASACRQLHAEQPLTNCVRGAGGLCPYPYADHHFLYQGKASLFRRPTAMPVPLSLYACSLGGGPSAAGAVLGLGRSGTLARTVGAFSYQLSDGQGDAIWLGSERAQRVQGGKPTRLISNPLFPNRYYVQIASILVGNQPLQIPRGALDIQQNGRGGVYLSTTMPVGMYLNREVYDLLKAALQAPGPDIPCYTADAKVPLPTITLVFAGDAVMALQPGSSVWKRREDGARCLSVWPSSTGETILGTRAQMGKIMTYELATGNAFGFGTVTF